MIFILVLNTLWFPIKPADAPEPAKATLYSLVYPGLGEYYLHEKKKAITISSLATYFLAKSVYHYWNYRVYRNRYLENGFYSSKLQYEDQFRSFMSSLFWYIGILGFSMVDSYISAHLFRFEKINRSIEKQFYSE